MSDSSILQEIDEEVQRKKLQAFWQKYGAAILGVAVAIVAITAAVTGWHNYRTAQEQKATAAFMTILEDKDKSGADQVKALEQFALDNQDEMQGMMAQFRAAAVALKNDDRAKAVAFYDAIAANAKNENPFRQLADLFSVRAQMDNGDPAALQTRLAPLLTPECPWRASAQEMTAFLALKAGERDKARRLFAELSRDASIPETLMKRAEDMVHLLGVESEK